MKGKGKVSVFKRFISFMLAFSLLIGSVYLSPTEASAAVPKLNRSSVVLVRGHGMNLILSGVSRKITWKTSNNSVVTFKKIANNHVKLTAKGVGSATVSAKAGSKTYKCSVKVINAKLNETKLLLWKNKNMVLGRSLKVSGAKVKKWVIKDTDMVKFSYKEDVSQIKNKQECSLEARGKKFGTTKVLAYVEDSILACTVTVKKVPVDPEFQKELFRFAGQHTAFDGLHIGDIMSYEDYMIEGDINNHWSSQDSAVTVPVYKGKIVDIRDEKMLQKALRVDKVVGKFYQKYIKSDMSDIDRLLAVIKYYRTIAWDSPQRESDYKSLAKCKNGCSACQEYINKNNDVIGFSNYAASMYARTAHAALYSNMAYREGWNKAFELLCVAAGLQAFISSYDWGSAIRPQNIKVNIDGYWFNLPTLQFFDGSSNGASGKLYLLYSPENSKSSSFSCQYRHVKSWDRYPSAKFSNPESSCSYIDCTIYFSDEKFHKELDKVHKEEWEADGYSICSDEDRRIIVKYKK